MVPLLFFLLWAGTANAQYSGHLVCIGDSIIEGVVPADAADICALVAARYPGITNSNVGASGEKVVTHIEPRFATDVVAANPDWVVIDGGVNDVAGTCGAGGCSAGQRTAINAALASMMQDAQSNGIAAFVYLIGPWDSGTTAQMQSIDLINAQTITDAATYGATILDQRCVIGEQRSAEATCWDFQTAKLYTTDGLFVHPNAVGATAMANLVSLIIGPCSALSTHVFYCPDTGNPYTNGSNLKTLLQAHSWVCGDTIVLQADAEYRRPDVDLGPDWPLPYQSDCTGGKKTQIISSRLSEIPLLGTDAYLLKNYRAMMPLMTTTNSPIWAMSGFIGGSNQYAFRGIRHSSTAMVVANRGRVSNLFLGAQFDTACPNAVVGKSGCQAYHDTIQVFRPRDFEIDRCIFEEYESTAFPEPNSSSTDGNSFIHSVSIGVYAPFDGLYLHDSYFDLTGYTHTSGEATTSDWLTMGSSATNTNPAVLSDTGLATALGITYSAACTTGTDNFTTQGVFDAACAGHFARVVVRGATGNWVTMNGPKLLRARADGSVDVLKLNPDRGSYIGVSYYDGTSLGGLTGTVTAAKYALLTQYAVTLAYAAKNIRIIDNFMQAWAMPIFTGGVDGPFYDAPIIQSGSTATSLILSHVRDLVVGMLVTFNVPVGSGPSSYCHLGAGSGCFATDHYRTGRVTAISGTTVTLEGWGPDGTDGTDPDIGGVAWWKNDRIEGVEVRGNAVSRGYLHPNGDAGKGATEMKHCDKCLWDGNVMGGYLDANGVVRANITGTYFTEAKSQAGTDPNATVERTRFSNNLGFGQLTDGTASCMWANALILTDNEHSIRPGSNVFVEHNVHIGCKAFVGTSFAHVTLNAGTNIGYLHNTFAVDPAQTPTTRTIDLRACDTYPESYFAEYSRVINGAVKNNIMNYGDGPYLGSPSTAVCWPTIAADVVFNLMVDGESVLANQAALDAVFPGNTRVADYTSFWAGTCAYDSWQNCKLHASNPNRGAASDGKDPGADIEQVRDRIERWSERAGLLRSDIAAANMTLREGNWSIGSTAAAVRFQVFESLSSACTVELFTAGNRNTGSRHGDAASAQACNRSSSAVNGNTISYVFGGGSALTANTMYYYRIVDGNRVMVGEFKTLPAAAPAVVFNYNYSSARTGNVCTNAAMDAGCSSISSAAAHAVTVPQGAIRYYQAVGGPVKILVAR